MSTTNTNIPPVARPPLASPSPSQRGGPDGFDEIIEIEQDIHRQRRRFWGRVLLGFFGVLIIAVILAPRIASLNGPRQRLLAVINRSTQPTQIDCQSWSLRWLGKQTLEGLTVNNPQHGVAAIEKVTLEAGLLRLIPMGRIDLGTITLTRPAIIVRQPAAVATETSDTPETGGRPPRRPPAEPGTDDEAVAERSLPIYDLVVDLRVIDGSLTVETPRGQPCSISQLQTTLALPSLREPASLTAAWNWEPDGGSVAVTGTVQTLERLFLAPNEATGELEVRLARHRLAYFAPWLVSSLGGVTPQAGELDARLRLTTSGAGRFTGETTTELKGFQAALPHEERPSMPPTDIRLAAQASVSPERITVNEAALVSPWLTVNGRANLSRQSPLGTHADDEAQLDLRAELVPLQRDWGVLLGMDPEVAITDGRVLAEMRLGNDVSGFWASATALATNLVVKAGTESSRFHPPPSLDLLVRRPAPNDWQVAQLKLDSAFASLTGAGSVTQAVVNGTLDLSRMARELRGLLPQLPRMIGRIDLHAESGRVGEEVRTSGHLTFKDVAVDGGAARPWVIEAGTLTAAATFPNLAEAGMPREFNGVAIAFSGTPGTLTGSCDRCVMPSSTNRWAWRVERGRMQANADLARTLRFLRPVFTLPDKTDLNGKAVVGMACEAAAGTFKLTYNGAVQQLRLDMPAWEIREPDARLKGAAEWRAADGWLRLDDLAGQASFGTLALPRATIAPDSIQGDLKATLNLAPLAGWRKTAGKDNALKVAGKMVIDAQAATEAGGSRLKLTARGDGIAVATDGFEWQEPAPALQLLASMSPERNIAFKELMLTNSLGYLTGSGALSNLANPHLDLSGDLALDFDAVDRLLKNRGMQEPRLKGFQPRPFSLSAPLGGGWRGAVAVGKAQIALCLEELQGWGLETAGSADIEARLADGLLSLNYAPPLANGSFKSQVRLDVGSRPMELQLDKQAIELQDVPLRPPMLRNLRFINPLLAGCTVIKGNVSVAAGNGRLPLDATYTTGTDFDVEIGLSDVTLMPTGVLERILAHTGASGKTIEIEQETLRGSCRNGTIEIAPHAAELRGHPVAFKGSVGLDQSVAFQTVVPLTEDLVGEQAARYIAGQTLTVPVKGTVSRPRIDEKALADDTRRIATEAARRAMAEQAGDLLDKLRKKIE